MIIIRPLLGILCILVGIVVLQLSNADLSIAEAVFVFIDAPTVLLIALAITGTLVAVKGRRTFVAGVKSAFSKNCSLSKERLEEAVGLFRLLQKSVICAGLLIFALNIIQMAVYFRNLPFDTVVISVAMLGIYYAIILNLVFFAPVITILQRRLNETKVCTISA